MEQAPLSTNQNVKGSYGSVLSILLIVLVLVMGAFYVWNKRINEERNQPMYLDVSASATTETP
ncbi:MAG: hypothetical protein KA104_00360 [Candidatus Pacebacteria bacterium]|nr:hypothetical protein [Candidatus Paceibacterota bacterium]